MEKRKQEINQASSFCKKEVTDKEIDYVLTTALRRFEKNRLMGIGLSNTPSLRRVVFFKHFLLNKGNATQSAIMAGYSPKSAKQQGYRTLRWIQNEVNCLQNK